MAQITSEEAVDSPTVQEEELEEEEEIQPSPRGMSPLRKAILIFFIGIALAVVYGKYKANAEARANRVVYAKRCVTFPSSATTTWLDSGLSPHV